MDDKVGLIRAAALMVPACWTLVGFMIIKPGPRIAGALLLAFLWNFWSLFVINLLAMKFGWWSFGVRGGVLYGVPVDLLLGWSLLWGPIAGFGVTRFPVWVICLLAVALDLLLMPACEPAVLLGKSWLTGEAAAVAVCLVPAMFITRLTAKRRGLALRAIFQMLLFSGLFLFIVPAVALQGVKISFDYHMGTTACLQFLFFAAVPGVSAVHEFALRGGGTPFPYDPTDRLVTTGPYAYVRNPMQVTNVLLFLVLMAYFQEWKFGAGAVISVAYSSGLAWWHETGDISRRFGWKWKTYSAVVPLWIPRWKPWRMAPAKLYVAASCEICQRVQRWLEWLKVEKLIIIPAEYHPDRDLLRITYDDSGFEEQGIAAVGRALEHVNFCWAIIGCVMRLPVVRDFLQLLCDELIVGPRRVTRLPSVPEMSSANKDECGRN